MRETLKGILSRVVGWLGPVLDQLQPSASILVILGAVILLVALGWFLFAEAREKQDYGSAGAGLAGESLRGKWLMAFVVILLVGGFARLWALGAESISHPEVYVPGIALPEGLAEPPPRLDILTVLNWHFFKEPHPLGYYVAMFAWVKLFGADLWALRLPAALLGILSIPLAYRVGALAYGRPVGMLSAALLAVQGLHIYWSRAARMYAPECFFGLAATWLLLEMLNGSKRWWLGSAYVLALVAGFSTEWFMWLLAGTHLIFILLHFEKSNGLSRRLLDLQIFSIQLGAFTISHALTARLVAASGTRPTWADLRDYLDFGFVHQFDEFSNPVRGFPWWFTLASAIFAGFLLVRGARQSRGAFPAEGSRASSRQGPIFFSAAGAICLMAGLALQARVLLSFPAVLFPLVVLAIPPLARWITSRIRVSRETWLSGQPWPASTAALLPALAVLPAAMIFTASLFQPMIAARAFLVFVPFLLVTIAAGAWQLFARRGLGLVVAGALAVFVGTGTYHYATMPLSPHDYNAVAAHLKQNMGPADVLLVPPQQWYATPLFYYLPSTPAASPAQWRAASPKAGERVWVAAYLGVGVEPDVAKALQGYVQTRQTLIGRVDVLCFERQTATQPDLAKPPS